MSVTSSDPATADPTAETDSAPRRLSLGRYVWSKALGSLVSLVMVVFMGFFAFRILPGDPTITMTRGRRVTPEEVARLQEQFGLNKPIWEQFAIFVRDLFRGDLGTSYVYNRPVSELMLERLWPTLLLTGTSAAIAVVIGLWIGQRAAWKRDSWFDRLTSGSALVLWSVPTFWLGLILSLIHI